MGAAWEGLGGFSFGVQTGPVGDLQALRVGVGEQDAVQAGDRVADIEGGCGEFRGAQDGVQVGDDRLGVARQRAGVGETLAGAVIATDLGEFGDGWLDQGPGGAGAAPAIVEDDGGGALAGAIKVEAAGGGGKPGWMDVAAGTA